jgi:hypothetical protein
MVKTQEGRGQEPGGKWELVMGALKSNLEVQND